jgi:hypothetical protein
LDVHLYSSFSFGVVVEGGERRRRKKRGDVFKVTFLPTFLVLTTNNLGGRVVVEGRIIKISTVRMTIILPSIAVGGYDTVVGNIV